MTLERTRTVLERGVDDGTHVGAQLSVSYGGAVHDLALGIAAPGHGGPGVAMTPDSMMIWFSMSKATCAVAVAQQWELGRVRLDDPVVQYLPAFGVHGKDRITLRHLLTHTAGIRFADGFLESWPWRESMADSVARICAARPERGWVPGMRAGYHPTSGMAILGAIVETVDGRSYDRYVREAIFEPLGMHDCWVGMPPERFAAYGERIGVMHNTKLTPPKPMRLDNPGTTANPMPGANGRGPMRQLRRLYEMLLGEGTRDGVEILEPTTVAALGARHRTQLLDETFGVVLDWGLGLAVDSYVMGRHCSRRAFGHGGMESSAAFCDPEHGLAVAVVCNGMPGGARHHPRMDAIATAIYEDLGLARGEDREHVYPVSAG